MSTIPFDILKRKARKEYQCVYCGEKILKGEAYSRASGSWDGDLQDWKMHNECLSQHDKENKEEGGDGTIFGGERPTAISAPVSPQTEKEEG